MKIAYLLIILGIWNAAWGQSGKVKSLFDSSSLPQPQTQGRAGSTIAALSAACQKITNNAVTLFAQSVAPQLQIATSPVIPFVGFTLGLIQNDSPVIQTCNLIINIDRSDTQGIIMQTGAYLNKLTANKFDAELNAVDEVLNTSNSIYDFTNGSFRQGSLANANNHQKLVKVLDATTKVYNKRIQNKNEGLETKAARRVQIEQVSSASYRRAIIQEASSCPTPQGNKQYSKLWGDYVPIRQVKMEDEKNYTDYLYEALTRMGTDMISDVSQIQEYMNLLNSLRFKGFGYVPTAKIYSEEDVEQTGKLDKQGLPKKNKITKTRKVNTFTVSVNSQSLNTFRSKYSTKWKKYIQGEMLSSGTFGLLSDKKGRIEAKYRNYAFECSERRLARTLSINPSDPLYQTRLNQDQETCRERLKIRQNDVESVFENYINQMVNSLQIFYKNQTEIWNFEATTLGYNREVSSIDSATPSGNYQTTSVSCSDKLEIHEMKKLSVENKKINNELKEAWAKAKIQNNIRREEEDKAGAEAVKSASRGARSSLRQGDDSSGTTTLPVSVQPSQLPKGL